MKKQDVFVNDIICEACQKAQPPMNINAVTQSLIYNISNNKTSDDWNRFLNKSKNKIIELKEQNNKLLESILSGNGVGSQIWKLLEKLGIKHNAGCGCLDWAERMNLWGPELCDKNRAQIIEHMKNSAKNYDWGDISVAVIKAVKTGIAFRLSILDPYGSLLDEAIRLAKEVDASVKKN